MSLSEDQLKDGEIYEVLTLTYGRLPSARWHEETRSFEQEWTRPRDGEVIVKTVPIADVTYISDFSDVPL